MKLTVYEYSTCSSCRKALKFLKANGIEFATKPIRETPPSVPELERMLKLRDGNLRKLFNTSGQDYQRLNLKENLPTMNESDALKLLASNGNLVKRPFVLGGKIGLVGFDESEWREVFVKT